MRKLFVILGVSLLLASCSQQPSGADVTTTDSTVVKVDTAKVDTTVKAVVDTTKK